MSCGEGLESENFLNDTYLSGFVVMALLLSALM